MTAIASRTVLALALFGVGALCAGLFVGLLALAVVLSGWVS